MLNSLSRLQNINISVPRSSSTSAPSSSPSSSHTKDNIGAIVGGVLGTLAFLLLVTTVIFIFWRKHKPEQPKLDPFTIAAYNRGMAQVSHQENVGGQQSPGNPRPSEPLPISGLRKTPISPPDQRVTAPLISREQRQALGTPDRRTPMRSELPLLASSNSDPTNVPGTGDLRAELDQLRREVESMQCGVDTLPEYT